MKPTQRPAPQLDLVGVETWQLEARRNALLRERSQLEQQRRAMSAEIAALTAELVKRAQAQEAQRRKDAGK